MNDADRAAIRKNTVALVEDLELTDLLDILYARGTITRTQFEELTPNTKTERRSKVRDFLGVIYRRGPNAFNDFYEGLVETNQTHLAQLLCPGKVIVQAKADPEPPASSPEPPPCLDAFINTPVIEINREKLSLYWQDVRDNKVYEMTSVRGRALVINNEWFQEANGINLPDRTGTVNDAMNLNTLFNDLKFDHRQEINLTAQGMRSAIEEETKNEEHNKLGMFVLVILSHGEKGAVYGVDGQLLQISEIQQLLGSRQFRFMRNKPKLVLLQACQGGRRDGGLTTDGPDTTDAAALPGAGPEAEFADILIANATSPGYVSYRDTNLGTFFIRAVVEVFRRNAWKEHVADMLTEVRRKVDAVSQQHNLAQGAYDVNHLRKSLYLLPGWTGEPA